jgi:hypothetical protein
LPRPQLIRSPQLSCCTVAKKAQKEQTTDDVSKRPKKVNSLSSPRFECFFASHASLHRLQKLKTEMFPEPKKPGSKAAKAKAAAAPAAKSPAPKAAPAASTTPAPAPAPAPASKPAAAAASSTQPPAKKKNKNKNKLQTDDAPAVPAPAPAATSSSAAAAPAKGGKPKRMVFESDAATPVPKKEEAEEAEEKGETAAESAESAKEARKRKKEEMKLSEVPQNWHEHQLAQPTGAPRRYRACAVYSCVVVCLSVCVLACELVSV